MKDAPIPDDDALRLQALFDLRILDTPAEERFNRITRTAKALFDVPIALISLVDAHRQWFKSADGLTVTETTRRISFCGHAILGDQVLVVENSKDDPRFSDNPLVQGPPHLRFYAGVPLRARDGWKLGTLCLLDARPRHFDAQDIARLQDMGHWAELELNRQVDIAAETAHMRESFVRLVSHELRTPVTSLIGALALLRSESTLDSQQLPLVDIAHDAAIRLNRLVDDIVELARLDAGELVPEIRQIPIASAIDAKLAGWKQRAERAGIVLDAQVEHNLTVSASPDWLRRILALLLDNALRFSPAGSHIKVSGTRHGNDRTRITVSDNGTGIKPEHLQRIFHEFSQEDSGDNRQHGGFGIGLAICQRLAVAMSGRLGYESVPEGGSRFFIDLPC